MAEIIRMPKLSDTMTEGVVAQWHKKLGDTVKSGELLADIETDKATMEFESFQEGTLLYIGVEKGKTAPVDSILAIVGKKGEDINPLIESDKKKAPAPEQKKEEPKPQPKVEEQPKAAASAAPQPVEKKVETIPATTVKSADGRSKVSPLAKKLASERHINLGFIKGSGDGGRVIKRDIENFGGNGGGATFSEVEKYTEEPVSQMRKTIAKRLAESKFTAPHFYLTMEIEMDEMIKAREAINAIAAVKISFNDIIVKAVAQSLRNNPKVNASWRGDVIRFNQHIHIGIAVAVDEGLLVPVIKFADRKTLSQISSETKVYAQKAKEKKLQPSDWEGNTFTISNLGMFGIEEFTAIINPPDACIMAVGGIREAALVKDGRVVPGHAMKVTMSCDHRVVDGATGAAFLQTFKQFMENPVILFGLNSI